MWGEGRWGQGCGLPHSGIRDPSPVQGPLLGGLWADTCPVGGRPRDGLGGPHLPDASSHLSPLRFTGPGAPAAPAAAQGPAAPQPGPRRTDGAPPTAERCRVSAGWVTKRGQRAAQAFWALASCCLQIITFSHEDWVSRRPASLGGGGGWGTLQASDGQRGQWGRLCPGPPLPGPTAQAATQPQQAP